MWGIGLGILAGWLGARNPSTGIGVAVIGVMVGLGLSLMIAGSYQDRIDPLMAAATVCGTLISGLVTWKLRSHYLKKRGEL
jgi:hypothetical protein